MGIMRSKRNTTGTEIPVLLTMTMRIKKTMRMRTRRRMPMNSRRWWSLHWVSSVINQQNVIRSGSHMQTSQTLW
jgi:hypothetical protein